ncbi:TPA: hypothetical protein MJB93_27415 [Klebsiella pneumoniae]|nr:hypothetical protein [Klebsiella pneumoniae]
MNPEFVSQNCNNFISGLFRNSLRHIDSLIQKQPKILIYYLLSIIYYLLSIIYYLLSIIYYLLSIIYYLLSIIYYLLSHTGIVFF